MKPLMLHTQKRTIPKGTWNMIADRLAILTDDPDDFIVLELKTDREPILFAQAKKHGNLVRVEIGFGMDEYNWPKPLLLGNDLKPSEAKQVLHDLLVKNQDSAKISLLGGFRQIDF